MIQFVVLILALFATSVIEGNLINPYNISTSNVLNYYQDFHVETLRHGSYPDTLCMPDSLTMSVFREGQLITVMNTKYPHSWTLRKVVNITKQDVLHIIFPFSCSPASEVVALLLVPKERDGQPLEITVRCEPDGDQHVCEAIIDYAHESIQLIGGHLIGVYVATHSLTLSLDSFWNAGCLRFILDEKIVIQEGLSIFEHKHKDRGNLSA